MNKIDLVIYPPVRFTENIGLSFIDHSILEKLMLCFDSAGKCWKRRLSRLKMPHSTTGACNGWLKHHQYHSKNEITWLDEILARLDEIQKE